MREKVFAYIRQNEMIQPGTHVVAGISGGSDSVCLLRLLKEYQSLVPFFLTAVYVEHGIRGEESIGDGEFVRELCGRLGVRFLQVSVDVPREARLRGTGIEETARQLRYEALRAIADPGEDDGGSERQPEAGNQKKSNVSGCAPGVIATAHHAQDQAETVLFHLIRGSSLHGLCGIAPKRDGIIRPLLCLQKQEILEWLKTEGESFRTDCTNQDPAYARNRIRMQVLPELSRINAGTVRHICQAAGDIREAREFLHSLCLDTLEQIADTNAEEGVCIVEKQRFLKLHSWMQKEVSFELLARTGGHRKDLTRAHAEAYRSLFTAQSGRRIDLPFHMQAESQFDCVILRRERKTKEDPSDERIPVSLPLAIPGTAELPDGRILHAQLLETVPDFKKIPQKTYTKWFDYDTIMHSLALRTRQPGDYLCIHPQGGRKTLKKYLIEEKIPADMRDEILLLADGSRIIWVIGHRISESAKLTEQTERVLKIWIESDEDK